MTSMSKPELDSLTYRTSTTINRYSGLNDDEIRMLLEYWGERLVSDASTMTHTDVDQCAKAISALADAMHPNRP